MTQSDPPSEHLGDDSASWAHEVPHSRFLSQLTERAEAAGFFSVGIAPAQLPDTLPGPPDGSAAPHCDSRAALREWLARGMNGEMHYMAHADRDRANAATVLPGARSVIVFAAHYDPCTSPPDHAPANDASDEQSDDASTVRIARYAVGEDYHNVLRERLAPVVEWLAAAHPGHEWRVVTDSAPLLERAFAVAAGVGFVGRNTMLIAPRRGSYFFLAEIVTTCALAPTPPITGTCGQCTRCLDACPTSAFPAPYQLDARACLSYQTIEQKTPHAPHTSSHGWAFGCDICQEVCPYNKNAPDTPIAEFREGHILHSHHPASELLGHSNREFTRRFARSPVLRPGRTRFERNVLRAQSPLPLDESPTHDPE